MKTRALFAKIASVSLLGLGLMSQVVWAQGNGKNQPSFVPGRILVKFKAGVSDGQARGLLATRNALSTNVIPQIGVHIVQLPPNANEQAEANAFKGMADVEFAEVDRILTPQAVNPNDYYYIIGYQWGLGKIDAPDAWSLTTGSNSVVIAVIDTGVDSTQPDLQGKLVPGWDIYDNDANTADIASHGTFVAGIVGALTNNSIGVAGVCWNCMIMPIRVTGPDQSVTYSNIASGVMWAANHGARVANASFDCTNSSTVSSAAQYLQSMGGVLTVAAGDYGTVDTNPIDPAIITVGATDQNDVIYSWSNRGSDIGLVAPGAAESTVPFNMYQSGSGTSVAAPFVAGVAALMLSVNPSLTPTQITTMLEQAADDLGAPGWDPTYGYGRLNAFNAVTMAAGSGSAATTTALISSLNPSTLNHSVTFTATVTPSAATGTVTFLDGTTTLGTGTLSAGVATFATASLAVATHSITAKYAGNSSYASSVSSVVSQVVNAATKINTTTALVSSLNPSTSGQSVTFNATVSPSAATGTVTFLDGSTSIGTGTLAGGVATFSTSTLAVATHSITASYGGDGNDNASTSSAVSQVVNAVAKTNTTTGLTANLNPSSWSQSVTLTATVSPSAATGTVTFFDGANTLGTGTVSGGVATFATTALPTGPNSLTASYGGNSSYNGSTSPVFSQTVNKANSTTGLASNVNPSNAGQMVTFTAAVAPAGATGTATFYDGATALGSSTVSGGSAAFSVSTLAVGGHSITATYNGDTNDNSSTSSVMAQTVSKANSTTGLTSSLNPSNAGQLVTFTATVSPSTTAGTVTFLDGATTLGTGTVSSGAASLSTSSLAVGTHSITASYSGDANDNGSTSSIVSQTVNTAPAPDFSISVSPSSVTEKTGTAADFTLTVSPLNGFTGTVSFSLSGATGSFSPATVTGSGSTSLSVATGALKKNSTTSLTITASSGGLVHTGVVTVHVHN